MKETIEIEKLLLEGENAKTNYQFVVFNGEVRKIKNGDKERLIELSKALSESKIDKVEKEFDDFYEYPGVESYKEPVDFAEKQTIDELKEMFEQLKKITIYQDSKKRREVQEAVDNKINTKILPIRNIINLDNIFIELFRKNRQNTMKKFLTSKKQTNARQSYLGSDKLFNVGTPIYDINSDKVIMTLDDEQTLSIIGIKYSYVTDNNTRISITIKYNDEKDKDKALLEQDNLLKRHNDATITKLIVKSGNIVGLTNPNCLALNNENNIKKGV